jgi:hypothetical protein
LVRSTLGDPIVARRPETDQRRFSPKYEPDPEKLRALQALVAEEGTSDVDWCYRVGKACLELKPKDSYRTKWLNELVHRLGRPVGRYQKYVRLAEVYGPDEIQEVRELGLAVSCVVELLRILDSDVRKKWHEKVAKGKWTVEQLKAALAKAGLREVSQGSAARQVLAYGPVQALRKLVGLADHWVAVYRKYDRNEENFLASKLFQLRGKQAPPDLAVRIKQAIAEFKQLHKALSEFALALEQLGQPGESAAQAQARPGAASTGSHSDQHRPSR